MSKFFVLIIVIVIFLNYAPSHSSASYDSLPKLGYKESPENPSEKILSIVQYRCPAENAKDIDNLTTAANNTVPKSPNLLYCVFTTPNFDPNNTKCKKPVRPIFLPSLNDKKKIECGFSENQFLYSFGFYLCGSRKKLKELRKPAARRNPKGNFIKKRRILELYEVCYDTSTNQTIWTRNELEKAVVFNKIDIQNEKSTKNEISTDIFFLQNVDFQNTKDIYELETTKDTSSYRMLPQPLVSPQHFAFDIWKKTTNHFINMAPLSENLVALMSVIDNGLKEAQMKLYSSDPVSYTRLKFYTRVVNSNTTTSTSSSTNDQQLLLPNIWHKFIYDHDEKTGVIIYLHNTPGDPPKGKSCDTAITCEFDKWPKDDEMKASIGADELQYAYCCPANSEKIKEIFSSNIDVEIKGTLDLNSMLVSTKKRDFDTSFGGSEMIEGSMTKGKKIRTRRTKSF